MNRALPTPDALPREAQRRLEQHRDPEMRAVIAACYPTDVSETAARLELEREQRRRIRAELEALRAFADAVEAGRYGPEGKEIARRLLAGGRTDNNLRDLRETIRRLR